MFLVILGLATKVYQIAQRNVVEVHGNRSCKSKIWIIRIPERGTQGYHVSGWQNQREALKNRAQVVHDGQAMHPTSWYGKYHAWIPCLWNHLSCCRSSSIKIPSFGTAFFCHMLCFHVFLTTYMSIQIHGHPLIHYWLLLTRHQQSWNKSWLSKADKIFAVSRTSRKRFLWQWRDVWLP